MSVDTTTDSAEIGATSHAFIGLPVSDGVRELILTLGWMSCVIGVAGNILIIVTLLTQPALRSVHNLYIGNLALADLAVVGYCVPFWLLDLILGYHPVVNQQHCVTNAFFMSVCTLVSIFTLVLISFNRYLSVCHPSTYSQLFGKTSIIVTCIIVWVVTGLQGLLPVFHVDDSFYAYSNKSHLCVFDGTTNPMNTFVIMSIIDVLVSTLLVGFFSLAIFRHWKKSRNRINQWNQNQVDVTKSQTGLTLADLALIRSLVLVFLLLILFCVPLVSAAAIMEGMNLSPDAFSVLILLFFLNNSINWIVYGALNKNFRKGYKQLLTGSCSYS